MKKIRKFTENFGGPGGKSNYEENVEKSEMLANLIEEISRVKDLLLGHKKGPLKEDYLNKILDFYLELKNSDFSQQRRN
jgi:hypothetical protein